ncbi:hypothetical protein, partial [Mycobacterium tuberculosis]
PRGLRCLHTRGRVCDLPVTSAAELATALGVPG